MAKRIKIDYLKSLNLMKLHEVDNSISEVTWDFFCIILRKYVPHYNENLVKTLYKNIYASFYNNNSNKFDFKHFLMTLIIMYEASEKEKLELIWTVLGKQLRSPLNNSRYFSPIIYF